MRARAGLALLLLGLLAVPAGACTSARGPDAAAAAAARPETPPRFRRMHRVLADGRAAVRREGARALRARHAEVVREGLALIRATLPHDVARTDVPRYLEGRASFGDALKQWVGVVHEGTDAQVVEAWREMEEACRGWIDAYLGLAPETSV